MRDIKFRVWDNDENNFWGEGRNLSMISLVSDSVVNDDSTVLEQYTGLNDKNGVEIYENDIISAPVYGFLKKGLVECSSGEWIFGNIIRLSVFMDSLTVIGNIHENADLLEVGNDI